MSIFIDPNQTFPITVKLKITGKIDDIATSIKILKPDEDGDDVLEIVCDVTGRDFDTMSKILEELIEKYIKEYKEKKNGKEV